MKKLKLIFPLICFCFFLTTHLSAQDRILLKNGDKIDCNIKELSDTEIKYTEIKDANQILFTISRGQVREIKFSYGKTIEEKPEAVSDSYFYDDKRSNLKLNFTALAGNTTILTYERSINLYSSFEVTPKIIGWGFNADNFGYKRSGFGLDLGYKMKLKSILKKDDYRPDHLLAGSYLRIAGGFAIAEDGYNGFQSVVTENEDFVHFGLDLGRQWILQNTISLDLYGGFHYFGGNFDVTDDFGDRYRTEDFSHGDLWGNDTIAFSFGLRVGFLFESLGKKGSAKSRR